MHAHYFLEPRLSWTHPLLLWPTASHIRQAGRVFFFFVFLFCARAPTVLVACNMTLADYMLGIVILKWHVTSYTEEVTVPPGLWG